MSTPPGGPEVGDAYLSPTLDFLLLWMLTMVLAIGTAYVLAPA